MVTVKSRQTMHVSMSDTPTIGRTFESTKSLLFTGEAPESVLGNLQRFTPFAQEIDFGTNFVPAAFPEFTRLPDFPFLLLDTLREVTDLEREKSVV